MEVKTYSRGRSATAAAKKALAHLDAFIENIEPADHGDKFIAVVSVKSGGGKEIMDAVKAAGFATKIQDEPTVAESAPEQEQPLADIEEGYDFDETTDEEEDAAEEGEKSESDELVEESDGEPLTATPIKGKGGYINEVSTTMGACGLARSIALSMPDAPRKEVIARCRAAGIAYGTSRTQIQRVRGGK